MTTIYKIRFNTTDLSSRSTAREHRVAIEEALAEGRKVEIDFGEVRSITGGFSDELVGVLASKIGFEAVLSRVALLNVREEVLRRIAESAQARLSEVTSPAGVSAP